MILPSLFLSIIGLAFVFLYVVPSTLKVRRLAKALNSEHLGLNFPENEGIIMLALIFSLYAFLLGVSIWY